MEIETTDDCVRIRFAVPVAAADAWDALTRAEAIAAWWGDHVALDPTPGGAFRETWTDGRRSVVTSGRVPRFEPPQILALTWADDDWPAPTQVVFTLREQPDASTRVLLEHGGWEALTGRDRRGLIAAHAAGWQAHLEALRDYLGRSR